MYTTARFIILLGIALFSVLLGDVHALRAQIYGGPPGYSPPKTMKERPNPFPPYSHESRRMEEEGTVVLRLLVTPQGTVADARIVQSTGYPRLDESAYTMVFNWRFHPATQNGKPILSEVMAPVRFALTSPIR